MFQPVLSMYLTSCMMLRSVASDVCDVTYDNHVMYDVPGVFWPCDMYDVRVLYVSYVCSRRVLAVNLTSCTMFLSCDSYVCHVMYDVPVVCW